MRLFRSIPNKCRNYAGLSMTRDEIETIIDQIADQRAENNKHFMAMWKLAFELDPKRASAIQSAIREGDIKISELNAKLANL